MLVGFHVDEVHNHDAAHIAEPQLPCNLFCGNLVHLEGVLLLVGGFGTDAAVDVYHIQRFGGFDYQIGALPHGNHLSKGALDLTSNLEVIVDGLFSLVEMDNLFLFRSYQGNVLPGFFGHPFVIDPDVGERVVEEVPQHGSRFAVFRKEQLDILVRGNLFPGAFPFLNQGFRLGYQRGGILAFRRSAYDGSVILGKNAPHQCLESTFLFLRANLLGDGHFLCEGEKYDVASCQ